jgi:hypothetical protein
MTPRIPPNPIFIYNQARDVYVSFTLADLGGRGAVRKTGTLADLEAALLAHRMCCAFTETGNCDKVVFNYVARRRLQGVNLWPLAQALFPQGL